MKKEMSLPVSVLDCGRVSASRPSLFAAFKAFMLRSAPVLFLASFYGRLLEMRFKEVTGQSIHKYIFHLRMERFAQLLQDSDAPLAELAAQAGISDLKNLSRQFKALKGTTPNKFRKGFRTLPGWS